MYNRKLFFFIFFSLCFFVSYTQKKSGKLSVSGFIIDKSSRQPIELASIQVFSKGETKNIKTVISDKKGKFIIDSVLAGTYLIKFSFIGFMAPDKELVIESQQMSINIGTIEMEQAGNELKEVSVTAKKALLNTSIDRKVYNVSQDIMAQTGTVSDILRNVPSVEVDIEGNISLRGSEQVLILINGRPSPLMGKNRAEVLQQIPANTIERIEVITNPSARFRPDGSSGIINIVMKKNSKAGFNGNIIGNIGNKERANGSLSLNYKTTKLNTFSTVSIRQDERNRFSNTDRQYFDANGKTSGFYQDNFRSKARPLSYLFRAGLEYTLDDLNSMGVSGSILRNSLTRNDKLSRTFLNSNNVITSQQDRIRNAPAVEKEKDMTIFWQHNFKKEGQELRFEATASSQSEDEKNYYSTVYNYPPKKTVYDNNWVNQIEKNQQITLDYTDPIGDNAKLEIGYAGSFIQQDIDFFVENFDTLLNKFVKNKVTSNRFLFNQVVHAFYATYLKSFKAFSFSLGLRAEQSFVTSNLVTIDSVIKNQYFQLFPTLHLAYQLEKGELQLNYSRRVNRPEGDDLNPFPEYIDPLNLRAGNPLLLPEFIHSVEFGYQWKNKVFSIVPSIFYRYKYNGFTSLVKPINDSVLLTTKENLSNDQSAGLELIISAKPGKKFTSNLSTNIFYNTINTGGLGTVNNNSIFSMSANFNGGITFNPTTMLQFSCIYRSARQTVQGLLYPTFVTNIGARKDLLNNKLSITITLSDIFKTLQQKSTLQTPYLQQTGINSRDAQVFYIGVNFLFGKSSKKTAEEKLQFDNAL